MKPLNLFTCLMIVSLLAGCQTNVVIPEETFIAVASTNASSPSLYTEEPGPDTARPSSQVVLPTITTIPSITLQPKETPTLTSEEVHEMVVDLMENNGNCQLPCWWGLQPGETLWESAQSFISALNSDIYVAGDPNKTLLAEVSIPRNGSIESEIFIRLVVKNQVIDRIVVRDIDDSSFQLASFLKEQGEPEEVWIHTLASNLGGPPPFQLFLYYKEQGFFAHFRGDDTSYEGDKINACISQEPELILSTPHPSNSFSQFSSMVDEDWGDEWHSILPIEEAMGISVHQFYDRYKSDEQICFKVSRTLWPEP